MKNEEVVEILNLYNKLGELYLSLFSVSTEIAYHNEQGLFWKQVRTSKGLENFFTS